MGVNTIHGKTKDKAEGFNITQNKFFRYEIMGASSCRKLEVQQGLEVNQITLSIQINGKCNVNMDDKVRVLGRIYKVVAMDNTFDNPELFRKRADYSEFTGNTVLGLQ